MSKGQSRHLHIDIDQLTVTEHDGDELPVRRPKRRFIPSSVSFAAVAKHFVSAREWIEYFENRYHRDPTQFHLSTDGTGRFHPEDLAAEIGLALAIRGSRF